MNNYTIKTSFVVAEVGNEDLYLKILSNRTNGHVMSLQVLKGAESWTGTLSNQDVNILRQRFEESEEEYYRNLNLILSDRGSIYDFTIDPDNADTAVFSWKRQYQDAAVVYGFIKMLKDVNPTSPKDLWILMFEESKKDQDILQEYEKILKEVKGENEKYDKMLKDMQSMYSNMRDDLIKKSTCIINEYKQKLLDVSKM